MSRRLAIAAVAIAAVLGLGFRVFNPTSLAGIFNPLQFSPTHSTVAAPPQNVAGGAGWDECYYCVSTQTNARGLASNELVDMFFGWIGFFKSGTYPASDATTSVPDSHAVAAIGNDGSLRSKSLVLNFTGGTTGDPAMSHSPTMMVSSYLDASNPAAGVIFGQFINPNPITITGIDVYLQTAPAGCTTQEVFSVWDNTLSADVRTAALNNGSNSSRDVTPVAVAFGHLLQWKIKTAAAGCTTSPAKANMIISYQMQ